MAEFLVTMYRHQYLNVVVTADDHDEAIQKAFEGEGQESEGGHGEWEYDGSCEELDD